MSSRRRTLLWLVAAAVIAASPLPAHAHLVSTGLGPVYDGIMHVILTLEDLIPVIALAMLGGLRGRPHAKLVMFVLPLAWLAGGVVGLQTGTASMTAAWLPFVALGGLVAADLALPRFATVAMAALLGLWLGWQNGTAMAGTGAGLRGLLGVCSAVFVVTSLVAAGVTAFQSGWRRIAWRVLGSWIAASGLLLLGWSFA